jgi:hypothetical protein
MIKNNAACMAEIRNASKILVWNLKGRDYSEDQDVDGKSTGTDLRKIGWEGVDWFIWLRVGTSGGLL